jgi:hypothetical protein
VPWYNEHPDFADFSVDLNGSTAVVIGAGNLAMDVVRILALEPSVLDPTDTVDRAIDALKASAVCKVIIGARRGPEHAAFTSPELRKLPKLEHTNVLMAKSDIEAGIRSARSHKLPVSMNDHKQGRFDRHQLNQRDLYGIQEPSLRHSFQIRYLYCDLKSAL